jgi:hypothetical protein
VDAAGLEVCGAENGARLSDRGCGKTGNRNDGFVFGTLCNSLL